MGLVKNFFSTSAVGSIINVVVFVAILAITLNFLTDVLGIKDGKFDLKDLKNIPKNIKENLPEFFKSIFITILIFGVFGMVGLLDILEIAAVGLGNWASEIIIWFIRTIFGGN